MIMWAIAIAVVLGAIYSAPFRQIVEDLVVSGWGVGRMILRRLAIAWVVLIALFTFVGAMTGSWVSGLFLAISIPFVLYLIVRSSDFRKFLGFATVSCLVIAGILFSIGLVSPKFKKSLNRYTRNSLAGWANGLNAKSITSEEENGRKVIVPRAVAVYAPDILVVRTHTRAGDVIKVLSLEKDLEGLVPVVLKNAEGNFIGGTPGRIAVDDLDLNLKPVALNSNIKLVECLEFGPKGGCLKYYVH